jgi:2-polyprenyl-3-methyl-5-hydroxy-6-metoxy-1,4-benzoquinol methylase
MLGLHEAYRSQADSRIARLIDHDLIDKEWNQVAWGNYETNINFLRLAGLDVGSLKILEIGCGKGAILSSLQRAGHTVSGIDVDADAIAECVANHPEIDATVASGDDLPFADASFDVVLSLDVFEHILETDRHLGEVNRVLKTRGVYLLQTPNKWTNIPFEVLRQWKKFHTGPITSYRELRKDHCALHSYRELKRRFVNNGFQLSFVDVPVVNDYFRSKMRTYLGPIGPALLVVLNPDRFPMFMRTNFYARAISIRRPLGIHPGN